MAYDYTKGIPQNLDPSDPANGMSYDYPKEEVYVNPNTGVTPDRLDVYARRLQWKQQQESSAYLLKPEVFHPSVYIDLYKSGIITLKEARIFLGIER